MYKALSTSTPVSADTDSHFRARDLIFPRTCASPRYAACYAGNDWLDCELTVYWSGTSSVAQYTASVYCRYGIKLFQRFGIPADGARGSTKLLSTMPTCTYFSPPGRYVSHSP